VTTEREVHCWADYHSEPEFGSDEWVRRQLEQSATCLLLCGHEGPHQWTPDSQIKVTFRRDDDL
jgi:hypothetical protein